MNEIRLRHTEFKLKHQDSSDNELRVKYRRQIEQNLVDWMGRLTSQQLLYLELWSQEWLVTTPLWVEYQTQVRLELLRLFELRNDQQALQRAIESLLYQPEKLNSLNSLAKVECLFVLRLHTLMASGANVHAAGCLIGEAREKGMDWWWLLLAGSIGGVLNSVAGGGSFITFPVLLFAGIPAISANATNTFAVSAGYVSGAYGFRHDIAQQPEVVLPIAALSLIGGAAGAWLLLNISEQLFVEAIPWLLLFATLLFVFGRQLSDQLARSQHARLSLSVLLVAVSAYGGFFNAGLGIVVLSYLVLARYTDINQMNGLKLLVSSCVSLSAIVVFISQGAIAWIPGFMVMIGSVIGGYLAARISRQIKPQYVRCFVTLSSALMTVYFFVEVYGEKSI